MKQIFATSFIYLLFSFIQLSAVFSQVQCSTEDRKKLLSIMEQLDSLAVEDKSMGELAVEAGKQFMGTPYVAKTLELPGQEQLVINVLGLDCTTFLENVVVLSRLMKRKSLTQEDYEKELEQIRYKEGKLDQYPSRLHYFTDWIYDNQQKGVIEDMTPKIGGKPYPKEINFMSSHRDSYAQLKDEHYYAAIIETEKERNDRDYEYCHIPKDELPKVEMHIQHGDLIAITTPIKGLDVVHVGIAFRREGILHMLHASTGSNEVEITENPLVEYLAEKKSQSGIMVARLLHEEEKQ